MPRLAIVDPDLLMPGQMAAAFDQELRILVHNLDHFVQLFRSIRADIIFVEIEIDFL